MKATILTNVNLVVNQFLKQDLGRNTFTVHEGHTCVSCGKSFSEAGTLKRHILIIQEGHNDHKCEYLGKSFPGSATLKNHIHLPTS